MQCSTTDVIISPTELRGSHVRINKKDTDFGIDVSKIQEQQLFEIY